MDLYEVDAVTVTVLVENTVDVLQPGSRGVQRVAPRADAFERPALRAEHGYALLLRVRRNGAEASVLYDGGLSRDGLIHNMDVLEARAGDLRALVLSHGHADHHGGLEGLLRRLSKPGLPLVLHPDVWRERRITFPTGVSVRMPPPSQADLEREGVEVLAERGPTLLLDKTVLVTGQVERQTPFERGFPWQESRTATGGWEPDPWVWDDQAIVVNLRDRGLIVLSGCSHAGAVNVVRQAMRVTGIDRLHAFVGGMHLSGPLFDAAVSPTVAAFAGWQPDVLMPGHCTGWRALHELAIALPHAFVPTGVGTTLVFGDETRGGTHA